MTLRSSKSSKDLPLKANPSYSLLTLSTSALPQNSRPKSTPINLINSKSSTTSSVTSTVTTTARPDSSSSSQPIRTTKASRLRAEALG